MEKNKSKIKFNSSNIYITFLFMVSISSLYFLFYISLSTFSYKTINNLNLLLIIFLSAFIIYLSYTNIRFIFRLISKNNISTINIIENCIIVTYKDASKLFINKGEIKEIETLLPEKEDRYIMLFSFWINDIKIEFNNDKILLIRGLFFNTRQLYKILT